MNIGITGHRTLRANDWTWTDEELRLFLRTLQMPLLAWTSLAPGADQHFAETALAEGAKLHVVLPFDSYEDTLTDRQDREEYRRLLRLASKVDVLQSTGNVDQDYYNAGREIVRQCNGIVAVWNGEPARGLGGTADIVSFARLLGKPVHWINPVMKRSSAL